MRPEARFAPGDKEGTLRLRLPAEEQELLRSLPAQLRQLIVDDPADPALRRLFPPAYDGDPEHETEYRRLMGSELRERHLAALSLLEDTVGAEHLDEEQAHGWLSALNELRLVLGTRLDVSEDPDDADLDPEDPAAAALGVYHYLTWLQDQLVEVLSRS